MPAPRPNSFRLSLLGCAIATAVAPAVAAALVMNSFSGTITNTGGGWIQPATGGDFQVSGGLSLNINNSGGLFIDPVLDSEGFVAGLHIPLDLSGTLRNTGSLSALPDAGSDPGLAIGLYLEGNLTAGAALINDGRIEAATAGSGQRNWAIGISVEELLSDAGLVNAGSIAADAVNAGGSGAFAAGLDIGALQDAATLANAGSIVVTARNQGTAASGYASAVGAGVGQVFAGASLSNSGRIVADAAALASVPAQAYGMSVYALEGTIENSGSIVARIVGSGEAYGIKVTSGGDGEVINTGTLLGGLDIAGAISVTNAGSITSWSHSPSRVAGTYAQLAAGELGVRVQDAVTFGSLDVGGVADFSGGNRIVVGLDALAQLSDGDVLHDVVRAGTLNAPDGFAVSATSLFWEFVPSIQPGSLDLVAGRVEAGTVLAGAAALPPGLAPFLERVILEGQGGDYAEFAHVLNTTPERGALLQVIQDMTTPALGGAAGQAARIASAGASNAVSARLEDARGAASGDGALAQSLWIKPFVGRAGQEQVGGVGGYDVDTAGFVIGIDGEVSESLRLGVAVASMLSDVEAGASSLDISTTQLALYGSYALGSATALDTSLSYAANGYDSRRRVGLAGSTALAGYDGAQLALDATLSRRFARGRTALVPSLALRYAQVEVDSYAETGAGPYDMSVQKSDEDVFLVLARADYELAVGQRGRFISRLGAGYDGTDAASTMVALGGNGPTYISNGIRPESMLVTAGLGYRHVSAKALEISAGYDLERRDDFLAQTLSVKFRLPF